MGLRPRRALQSFWLSLLLTCAPSSGWGESETKAIDLRHITIHDDKASAPAGNDARAPLTLKASYQRAAQRLLAQAEPVSGAIVVIDARSGEVLTWAETARDGRRGFITLARAPAASVFKIVTTAALFEHTNLQPNEKVCITGGMRAIEREHLETAHGSEVTCGKFSQALGHSRNAVFAQLATKHLLRNDLLTTAESLGFNGQIPFDVPATMGTLVVPYNDLEFARAAAGFQGSTLSPLGAAYLASIIARGGEAIRFRILDQAEEVENTSRRHEAEVIGRVLGARTARRISRMMEVTVRAGTSRAAFSDERGRPFLKDIRVAGKTGTLHSKSRGTTTSWFTGFAPSRKPEIIVSVMLQNAPVWRKKANELARDVLRVHFRERGRTDISDPFEPITPKAQIASSAF